MRRLAAYTFILASTAALAARVTGAPEIAVSVPLTLALWPLETAPLLPLPDTAGFAALSLPAHPEEVNAHTEEQISIVLVGDTGLNSSFQPVQAGFALRYGSRIPFGDATPDIAELVSGDVNFANLETVVTDHNRLSGVPKMFGFRTHPDGVRALMHIGFNAFSTANNHALDYGAEGAGETLRHLNALGVAHAGLGRTAAGAADAALIERRGIRVAFGAIGLGGTGFGGAALNPDSGGQLALTDANLERVVLSLMSTDARVRMLSVHHGDEFDVKTSASERARFQDALARGVDIVVGHHQHVVAGIERAGAKVIFHGLGNFLHWGTQDMGRHDMCRDYGLVARVHLAGATGAPLDVRAIEAIPITDMHVRPRRLGPTEAGERIHVLNHLGEQFGAQGVRFGIEPDGTGLYCAAGAERLQGPIGQRCANAPVAISPPASLASRIAAACARRVVRETSTASNPIPDDDVMNTVSMQAGGNP